MRYVAIALAGLAVFFASGPYRPVESIEGDKMEKISLPGPEARGSMSVEEAIKSRRSERRLSSKKLSLEQIGQLCWAAQGITDKARGFRSAPSAGALYPLELYLVTEKAVYHYLPGKHALEAVLEQDVRKKLVKAALNQDWFEHAPLIFVITGVYKRTMAKYGNRGRQYVHMEVGYVAQNIHLQAVALGLGSTSVGAFYDDKVEEVIRARPGETALLLIPAGYVVK